MRTHFLTIRDLPDFDQTVCVIAGFPPPPGQASGFAPYPSPTVPARIDYDIPTYLRRGIKLSELPERLGESARHGDGTAQ